tara:strand:+ start:1735 stop:3102 length:1368 start_codon:yes stop_codon:yes gene_type:complete
MSGFVALAAVISMSATTFGAEQIIEIEATGSGRIYADYTFQDCCDIDSFASNEASIPVGPCGTMGGYCMSGTKRASWMFQMPDLEPGSELLSISFDGRHSGGAAFSLRGKWFTTGSYGYSTALEGWNNPFFTNSVSSSGGNFSAPLPIDLDGGDWDAGHLMLSAYRSTYMTFNNSGTLRPKIRMVIGVPDQTCDGDMNDDDSVDVVDLLAVIAEWGNPYNVTDLLKVIEHWDSDCEQPGACCLPTGGCESTDETGCEYAGGVWNGTGTFCSSADCPEYGACCLDDQTCEMQLADACKDGGGSFRGGDTDCSTTNCTIAEYNDECVDATMIYNGSTAFSTIEATNSTDLFSDQCSGTYLGAMNKDLWFSYQATCTGTLVVSTCDSASFDTDLVVYQGTCSDMTQIACNGDASICSGYTSYLETPVTSGTNYLIRLGGWDESAAGTGTLEVSCDSTE